MVHKDYRLMTPRCPEAKRSRAAVWRRIALRARILTDPLLPIRLPFCILLSFRKGESIVRRILIALAVATISVLDRRIRKESRHPADRGYLGNASGAEEFFPVERLPSRGARIPSVLATVGRVRGGNRLSGERAIGSNQSSGALTL